MDFKVNTKHTKHPHEHSHGGFSHVHPHEGSHSHPGMEEGMKPLASEGKVSHPDDIFPIGHAHKLAGRTFRNE